MHLLVQRVSRAKLWIADQLHCEIKRGYVLLVCAESTDQAQDIPVAVQKVLNLRLFRGEGPDAKPMDRSLLEIEGELMVVSQFTLAARVGKGRRPSFDRAMPPATAKGFFEETLRAFAKSPITVQSGVFGANMQVELVNDGPVTIGFRVHAGKVHDEHSSPR